jgi:hypothetical protein
VINNGCVPWRYTEAALRLFGLVSPRADTLWKTVTPAYLFVPLCAAINIRIMAKRYKYLTDCSVTTSKVVEVIFIIKHRRKIRESN